MKKQEDHPSLSFRSCLFNIVSVKLHIWSRSLRICHAVKIREHVKWKFKKVLEITFLY
jgi:hypothetical protein